MDDEKMNTKHERDAAKIAGMKKLRAWSMG
jgi:hypothetical protein